MFSNKTYFLVHPSASEQEKTAVMALHRKLDAILNALHYIASILASILIVLVIAIASALR